jgi:adenosylcobinamide-GDP ribazoletransferase
LIRRQITYFFGALRFFTRLPTPESVGHSSDDLNHSARYFPWIGIIVGALAVESFDLALRVLPPALALYVSMAVSLLVTGAFHEDGFIDFADGFGGGWEKPQILTIMKDSRVGSFGALAAIFMILGKFLALKELPLALVCRALLVAHPLSRFWSGFLIFWLDYVRENETSRSKPLARRMSRIELAVAASGGFVPLVLLSPGAILVVLLVSATTTIAAGRYFVRRIGGYTGDCLGAVQQLTELSIYLGLAGVQWTSI